MIVLLSFVVAGFQDPASQIDRLSSESVEEREEAFRRLLDLGEAARPELERVRTTPDSDLAVRVASLLRRLDFRRTLTPGLLRVFPNLDQTLADAGDEEWTKTFLEAAGQVHSRRLHPELEARDLDLLAPRALRGATRDQRTRVTFLIGVWNLRSATPELLRGLGSTEEEEQAGSLRALRLVGDRLPAEVLRPLLSSGSGWVRHEAISLAGEWRVRELLPELMTRLKSGAETEVLLQSIGECGDERTLEDIVDQLFRSGLAIDRREIAGTLSTLGGERALAALQRHEKQGDEPARQLALELICGLRTPQVVPELKRLLGDRDFHDVYWALRAVEALEARELIPEVRALLGHPDALTRDNAAWVLAGLGDSTSVPFLVEKLKHPESTTLTILRLGRLDARPAFSGLLEHLNQGMWEAAVVLARQGGEGEIAKIVSLCETRRPPVALCLAYGLALSGREEALPFLISGLRSSDKYSRNMASMGLSFLTKADTWALLSEAAQLEAGSSYPSTPAIRALGRVGGRRAVPRLLALLDHDDEWHRVSALESIRDAAAWDALPKVRALLTDDSNRVREEAACVLLASGSVEGVRTLIPWGRRYFYLNAIRRPAAWKKLAAVRFETPVWRTGRSGLEELAREAGLKLEVAPAFMGPWPPVAEQSLDAVSALGETSLIVEDGVLRVDSEVELRRFWRRWWESESRK